MGERRTDCYVEARGRIVDLLWAEVNVLLEEIVLVGRVPPVAQFESTGAGKILPQAGGRGGAGPYCSQSAWLVWLMQREGSID